MFMGAVDSLLGPLKALSALCSSSFQCFSLPRIFFWNCSSHPDAFHFGEVRVVGRARHP
jgi:hypothetical protein